MADNNQGTSSETTDAAGNSSSENDLDAARRFQAVESLTSVFGFPERVALQAVDAVGFDVTTCYNYILDNGLAKDSGGPVTPIDNCPHVELHVRITHQQLNGFLQKKRPQDTCCSHATSQEQQAKKTGSLKQETEDDGSCPARENWICLECGVIRCSRYENGHAQAHWQNTRQHDTQDGHCIYISFSDLSVWCNCCSAYLKRDATVLPPLLDALEKLKFLSQEEQDALPKNE